MEVEVNVWAVLLAGLSTMVVGSIWYAKGVFGASWAKMAKVNLDKKVPGSEMAWLMGSTLVASLVTAYVLAHVTYLSYAFFDKEYFEAALMTGFWLWLGFTATRIYVHDAFESRRKKLTVMTVSHEFVTIMVMASVIGIIGL